ncbi:LptF/LptG family permease [Flavicella sp.]|uniref:LptF/LptG family permease n=1 Tax=Flavicella sp. TaxID=2957742 RepID=UPI002616703E|nr:LptF/LptG family permease [Flavicella sp.]MDG1806158.1 LptF/LptG family permease [Flavicella sp.]MDG2279380.1 LptF/LptG family permease [Flavicella sp.]
MRILDKYILKKYLGSFFFTLFILIPIAIAIDVSEKIDKFLRHTNLSIGEIIEDYYVNFIIYYANTFMPLALFISVIFFTSKLSNNTEIIAINSASISFTRFLKPYFIGATLVVVYALFMNHYVVPNSNETLTKFDKKYFANRNNVKENYVKEFSMRLGKGRYIYIQNFGIRTNRGYDFSYEEYDGLKMKYRLTANEITWSKKDSTFSLKNFTKRKRFNDVDSIEVGRKFDTIFDFSPKDLLYVDYLSKEMTSSELKSFIAKSQDRGVKNLNAYYVELYKRTTLPISSYIMTLLAVCLSFRKKRGGMGINMAVGIGLMFIYVFFMKVAEVLGAVAGSNTILLIWMPNIAFGSLAFYLYLKSKK